MRVDTLRIVQSQQRFTEQQLRDQYERTYGPRVQVRHIQLATPGQVGRVQERLAGGEDFAELARIRSANQIAAQNGGLLDPFSRQEDELAANFKKVAFSLEHGRVSGAVRVGEWYHLIKVERHLPPSYPDFEAVRADLEDRLRERLTEPAMHELYEKLIREANIEISDPAFRAAFDRRHNRLPK